MEESRKAQENGEIYATRTVANAAAAVGRRTGATQRPNPATDAKAGMKHGGRLIAIDSCYH